MTLEELKELGFDLSSREKLEEETYIHVGCSQCEAVFINGVPCHEHGCPNRRRADELGERPAQH